MTITSDDAPAAPQTAAADPELRSIPLELIAPPTRNVRVDLTNIEELAASIRDHGVLSAVTVAPLDDGTYQIIAGARRREAALRAGLASLPALVRQDLHERIDSLGAQIAENVSRVDLSNGELLAGVQQMLELGATDEQLTASGVVAADGTETLRAVVALGDLVHERIACGQLSFADAAVLAPLAGDEEYLGRALAYLDRGWDPRRAVQEVLDQRKRERRIAAATAKLEKKGVRVIDRPSWEERARVRPLGKHHGEVPVDSRRHAKLACHAAYVDPHATRGDGIVYVCTEPRAHATTTPESDHGLEAAQSSTAKAAETRAQRKAWRATHSDRFAFTAALIRELALDDAMRRAAEAIMPRGEFGDDKAAAMAVQLLTGEELGEARPGAGRARLVELAAESGEGALRAAVALLAAQAETAFLRPEGDHRQARTVAAHFRLMTAHNYPLSAAEVWQLERGFQIRSVSQPEGTGTPLREVLAGDDDDVGSHEDGGWVDDDLVDGRDVTTGELDNDHEHAEDA